MYATWAILKRDLLKFFRGKIRMLSALFLPLLMFIIFSIGFKALLKNGQSYPVFLAAGILVNVLIMSANASAYSVLWDRESGLMKLVLASPVSNAAILSGKILGIAIPAFFQGLVLMIFLPVLGVRLTGMVFFQAMLCMIPITLFFSAISCFLAFIMDSYEDFNAVVLFNRPLIFLSGLFFPINPLPEPFHTLALLSPLTYCIDLLKNVIIPQQDPGILKPDFCFNSDLAIVTFFMTLSVLLAFMALRKRE